VQEAEVKVGDLVELQAPYFGERVGIVIDVCDDTLPPMITVKVIASPSLTFTTISTDDIKVISRVEQKTS